MADSWEDLPDVQPKKESWEDLPDVSAAPPAKKDPGLGRAMAEGALEGGTYGHSGEIQGLLGGALPELLINKPLRAVGLKDWTEEDEAEDIFGPPSVAEAYRRERNAADKDRLDAKAAHELGYGASQLGAAILAPGPKAGGTVKGFMKAGAKGGTAYGFGTSTADATKGDLGEYLGLLGDTAAGGGIGAAAGFGAGLLNKPLQAGARKLTELGRKAWERGVEKGNKPINQVISAAGGKVGGETSAGTNASKEIRRIATDESLPEDIRQAAAELIDSEGARALNERTARNTIKNFGQRLPRIEKAEEELAQALERGTPEARDAAVQALMAKSPMKRALWEIAKRVGPGLGGAALGGQFGGAVGAGVGGTLGMLGGAVSGAPGRLIRNAISSPQTQQSLAQAGVRGLEEAIPGAMAGTISEQAGNPQSMTREKLLDLYAKLLGEEKKPDEPAGPANIAFGGGP